MKAGTTGPRWGLVLGGLALLSIATSRLLVDVLHYAGPCPFRDATGLPCPTCFGLRALAAIGRGEIGAGILLQPGIALAALAALAGGAVSLVLLLLRRPPLRLLPASVPRRPVLLGLLVAAALANWAFILFRR